MKTMQGARKKEIYDICVIFGGWATDLARDFSQRFEDVIIVEDDPYHFLQLGPYVARAERSPASVNGDDNEEYYLSQLVPSYLRYVLRFHMSRIVFKSIEVRL